MTIRRKLFFGFAAAAAVPLLAVAILARLYVQRERDDIEQHFIEDAQLAFHRLDVDACDRVLYVHQSVSTFLGSLVAACTSGPTVDLPSAPAARAKEHGQFQSSPVSSLVSALRYQHKSVVGVKVQVLGNVLYSDLTDDVSVAGLGEEVALDWKWREVRFFRDPSGRYFFFAQLDVDDASSGMFVQIDPQAMLSTEVPFHGGAALYLGSDGKPRAFAEDVAALPSALPLRALAVQLPSPGALRSALSVNGSWLVYAAPAAQPQHFRFAEGAQLLAAAPESELYAAVARFQLEVVGAMLLSVLVALGLSYWLSGRFTDSVENLKRGVDALSRGDFAQLQKSSGDELGGELVDSMNRMAGALAERTRREEIESWRRLVRVLSHEINNTLGPVKSVATTVRDQIAKRIEVEAGAETAEDLRTAFRLIVDRVDSLSSFISGYAVLAKLPPPERAPADFNEVVRGAVSMLRETAGAKRLALDESYDPAVYSPLLPAALQPAFDRQQIERVAINLIKNAVEAAAGRVQIRTERRGDMIELYVEDDGAGIAPEARAHLFVPYYTTKPGGSGIGLALARQIVLGHGGTIGAEERPSGGTLLRVVLPTGALI